MFILNYKFGLIELVLFDVIYLSFSSIESRIFIIFIYIKSISLSFIL